MKAISAIAITVAAFASIPAFAADDAPFLTDALKGDNSEVALGKLAEARGASPQTRAYGAMLIQDHGAHRDTLVVLDRSMGIRPTSAVSDDGMKVQAMLSDLRGARFDAAFKQHMIEDHRQGIAKYELAERSAQSPMVRAMAQETLPTLHKHLERAEAL